MKVLMLGWEFPPMITGGLGTACQGLTKELSQIVEKITFVVPHYKEVHAREDVGVSSDHFELRDASKLINRSIIERPTDERSTNQRSLEEQSRENTSEATANKILNPSESRPNVTLRSIPSSLTPYLSPQEYQKQAAWIQKLKKLSEECGKKGPFFPMEDPRFLPQVPQGTFHGGYGRDLLSEVARFSQAALAAIQLDDYDVIHAHDWMTFPAGILAKKYSGNPLIVHIHSLEFDRCGENVNQQVYDIERWGLESADRVVAVSQRTKEMIVSRYGIPENKVLVIHNGIGPLQKYSIGTKYVQGPLVVFMGRMTMQKGPEYFLNAAYLVSKEVPNAHFVMAGIGDMRERMILKMAEMRLMDRVHFTGFVNERQRSLLLSMASAFVLSSVSEPFGLTPMEALQFGVPVIVSRQSGVSEILHHVLKVDFWDIRKMADAIIKVLTEPSLATQLSVGGKQELNQMSWQVPARRVRALYEEVSL